jgi:hypothetical protein
VLTGELDGALFRDLLAVPLGSAGGQQEEGGERAAAVFFIIIFSSYFIHFLKGERLASGRVVHQH